MRRLYIHQQEGWPKFHWSAETIAAPLASVRDRQSRLLRHMGDLRFNLQQEAVLQTLTTDILTSSEIEGEKLNAEQVRSSIARCLGIDIGAPGATTAKDRCRLSQARSVVSASTMKRPGPIASMRR